MTGRGLLKLASGQARCDRIGVGIGSQPSSFPVKIAAMLKLRSFRQASAILTALLATLTLNVAPAAAELPACPADEEIVTTQVGMGFMRAGQTVRAYVLAGRPGENGGAVDGEPDRISNVAVTGPGMSAPVLLTPFNDAGVTSAIVGPVADPGVATVVFGWDQDATTSGGCHGTDRTSVRVIPAADSAGSVDGVRLSGKWRVKWWRGVSGKSAWTLKPKCDWFACTVKEGSNTYFRVGVRTYRTTYRRFDNGCTVTRLDGSKRVYRYRTTMKITLRASGTPAQPGRTIAVRASIHIEPTESARDAGCTGEVWKIWRGTGRKVS